MVNKILNLDDLAPPAKVVNLDGKSFNVKEMTVADFVKRQQEAKTVEATQDPGEQMKRAVTMLTESIPDLPRERLDRMTMPQIIALINFIVTPPEDLNPDGTLVKPTPEGAEAGNG